MKDAPGPEMEDRETTDEPANQGQPERGKDDSQMQFGVPNAIGDRLKAYYNDVASEPVPDRFISLLEALDRAEAGKTPKKRQDDE